VGIYGAILIIDAAINLALGLGLLFFPDAVVELLGIPRAESAFYASILGAVLIGIALALVIELRRNGRKMFGLGLGGAVAINLCGGLALAVWLISGELIIPWRGRIFLWTLVFILLAVSGAELLVQSRKK